MHAPVLLCISQHIKFKVTSFTTSKYMIGAKLENADHVILTTPIKK